MVKSKKKKPTRKLATKKQAHATKKSQKRTTRPFKGADFVKQTSTNYKIQKVCATTNGLKVNEKTLKRTPQRDRQFSNFKKTHSKG